jgi:hypothetical protein
VGAGIKRSPGLVVKDLLGFEKNLNMLS